MSIPLLELARESFFRPRTAAQHLIGLNLSKDVILQAAMLLAVLTVLSQYLLFVFFQSQVPEVGTLTFSAPFVDVAIQFVNVYIVSYIVVLLARGIRINVDLSDAIVVYLWFNFLLIVLLTVMISATFLFGLVGSILIFFIILWAPYTIAVFWSKLLGSENLFLGFVIATVAFLITSAISIVVVGALGLPVMEITQNV